MVKKVVVVVPLPWTWFVIAELVGPPTAMLVVGAIVTAPIMVVVPTVSSAIGVMLIPIVIVVPMVRSAVVSCGLQCYVVIW